MPNEALLSLKLKGEKEALQVVWTQRPRKERNHIAKHLLNPEEAWHELHPSLQKQNLSADTEALHKIHGAKIHREKTDRILIADPELIKRLDHHSAVYRAVCVAAIKASLAVPTYARVNGDETRGASYKFISPNGLLTICNKSKHQTLSISTAFRPRHKSVRFTRQKLSNDIYRKYRMRSAVRKMRDSPSKIIEYTSANLDRLVDEC
jgi:hypothetical protein